VSPVDLNAALRQLVRDVVREVVREELASALAFLREQPAQPTKIEQPELLTPDAFAKLIGVSRSKAYRLMRSGLPTVTVGASKRIDAEDAVRWLKAKNRKA
jgi:hypothetical protein